MKWNISRTLKILTLQNSRQQAELFSHRLDLMRYLLWSRMSWLESQPTGCCLLVHSEWLDHKMPRVVTANGFPPIQRLLTNPTVLTTDPTVLTTHQTVLSKCHGFLWTRVLVLQGNYHISIPMRLCDNRTYWLICLKAQVETAYMTCENWAWPMAINTTYSDEERQRRTACGHNG